MPGWSIENKNDMSYRYAWMIWWAAALLPALSWGNCRPAPPPFYGYSIIGPKILDPRLPGAQLWLDFDALEAYYRQKGDLQAKDNLEEWQERFCGKPDLEDIRALVYHSTIGELEQLSAAIQRKTGGSWGARLSRNTFADYLLRHRCLETVTYLIFAKECEPYVTRRDPWDAPRYTYELMQRLIERGRREFRKTKSHYIRLRYAYQLIRLAHYSKEYEQALRLHDELMPQIDNQPSIIEYWIMGHRAGALMALGQHAEATYLFSRVFEHSPAKRESAYRSFKIRDDAEWQQCLLFCQNDRERAVLYAMRASMPNSQLLEEMRHIYALDPASPFLELLLIREMKKLERDLLGLDFNRQREQNRRYHQLPRPDAGQRVIRLQRFVYQVLAEGLLPDESVWRLADGYLAVLAGNDRDARQAFENARKVVTHPLLREQLEAFELALAITAYPAATDAVEEEIGYMRQFNRVYRANPDFARLTNDKLTQLFRRGGMPGKAFLVQHSLQSLRPNPQLDILDELIAICLDTTRTRLETQLVIKGDSTILNELLDMKATYLMSQYQFEAALETLKRMKRVEWGKYGLFSPFVERLNDCVHCRLPDTVTVLNKGELLERLLDMEYRAKAGLDNPALLYYRLGLALYNMSYFGYSWRATGYYRSGSSLSVSKLRAADGGPLPDPRFPFGNREHFDCSQARYYFERARLLADNPDLAARATFMAAKCERNEYYANRWREGAQQTFDNFEILMRNYSDTPFFLRVIQECKYFQAYAFR